MYQVVPDPSAAAQRLIRIVDKSGEDCILSSTLSRLNCPRPWEKCCCAHPEGTCVGFLRREAG